MKRGQITYNHGEPVWAKVDGFPWWPARVVSRDEITLDEGEPEPQVHTDEALIEFFNDEKRFAPVPLKNLRPFLNTRHANINRGYSGQYLDDVRIATIHAKEYVAKRDASKQPTFSPRDPGLFKHGEALWAKADGFPWWPARIINMDDIDDDQPMPHVGELDVLVQFFNADKRCASISVTNVRPFRNARYANMNIGYKGDYVTAIVGAVKEATAYIAKIDQQTSVSPASKEVPKQVARGVSNAPKDVSKKEQESEEVPTDVVMHEAGNELEEMADEEVTDNVPGNGPKDDRREVPGKAAQERLSNGPGKEPNITSKPATKSAMETTKEKTKDMTTAKKLEHESKKGSIKNTDVGTQKNTTEASMADEKDISNAQNPSVAGKQKGRRCFRVGEVVWAKFTGFPWWPARIVEREEITLDQGEAEPELDDGEALVEFFNDEERFAVVQLAKLHPFFSKRYASVHRNYKGQYVDPFRVAVKEAEEYSVKVDFTNRRILYF